MKKLNLLFIAVLAMASANAQDITDALRYSQDEVQGTARYRAMSGAFGALGGDMSAVSVNPAGSSVFNHGHASISLSNFRSNNDIGFFNGASSASDSKFDLNQAGAVFVFNNTNDNSAFKKFSIGFAYDKTSNFDTSWRVNGVNNNSIGNYFLDYAQGAYLDEISALDGESLTSAYSEINRLYGFSNQQAFLGFESYILEPLSDADDNTQYTSNIVGENLNQSYSYASTGFNGKFTFNASTQIGDNFYFGLNLNSHFINFDRFTDLKESNNNDASLVREVRFQNSLSTVGNGFSFQVGGIAKLNSDIRVGLSYNSPTWYSISEETTQYLGTIRNEGGANLTQIIDPRVVNVFPDYKLQTPGKITGSLAYIFGTSGLISFDYSLKNYGNTKFKPTSDPYFASQNDLMGSTLKNASTYKIGGEYRIQQLSLRAGYRFEESPYENESFYGNLNGYSVGLGYSFGTIKVDFAYDHSQRDFNQQLYAVGLTDAVNIDNRNSNFMLTLGFTL